MKLIVVSWEQNEMGCKRNNLSPFCRTSLGNEEAFRSGAQVLQTEQDCR
jgi:hypothetical protein